jgi:hypothetical protein
MPRTTPKPSEGPPDDAPTVQISIRVPTPMLAALEELTRARQLAAPYGGVTRARVIVEALALGLVALGARDAGRARRRRA